MQHPLLCDKASLGLQPSLDILRLELVAVLNIRPIPTDRVLMSLRLHPGDTQVV